MSQIIIITWPLFALILLGFILKRKNFFPAGFWSGAEKINYFFLFPALLINGAATAPLDNPQLLTLSSSVLVILGIASVLLILLRFLLKWPPRRFGVYVQGTLRFNTYLGLAITTSIFGSHGVTIAILIIAILVPMCNVISVLSLVSDRNNFSFKSLLLTLIKNPLIIACFIGISVNLTHIGLPFGSAQFFKHLSSASLPLGLICIGASLQMSTLRMEKKAILVNCAGRLFLMPLLAFSIAVLFGLETLEASLLALFFAIPTAPTAYILTRQLNGDSQLMAGIITFQTVISTITLPVILLIATS
ncbi:AEC family transporter [Xenorhabdus szentirmaii]|uniref:Auxin Efflux Carrier n=1 Tax=Xenorhabdus szentirmaii DSM 16338 TaxID=1427518 RepID=W1IXY2_9GAMM|nr:AEC family transporter [Xenorhabdus szentirmaii]PHM35260.1 transporter [Xenorhabdus szentirmaii DSM 16338]CDL82075.1 conserved membrane hypothetical protein [Xenorhabdus szentirmaii DSM 16338]